jgi:predicted DNA-binding WGR domain protein/very-short-patch-repair endonuclease
VLAGISRWRDAATGDSFEDDQTCIQLTGELRKRGYLVDANVGHSHFRVDLAVRRREEAQYRLGILVDLAVHYEQTDALERDMMRPRLLRGFGWQVARVLAKDWYSDRDRELARIIGLLEGTAEDDLPPDDETPDEDDLAPEDGELNSNGEPITETLLIDPADTAKLAANAELLAVTLADGDKAADARHTDQSNGEPESLKPAVTGDPAPAVVLPTPPTAAAAGGELRYLEFRDDKSSKFWEIRLAGNEHTVRFGRIGTSGQSQTKVFGSEAQARHDADRLIREKLHKGYRELSASTESE